MYLRFPNFSVRSNGDPDVPHLTPDESDDGDYQTYNVSDFFISDMGVTGLSFDGNIGFYDVSEAKPCLDYNCSDSDMMFDMAERYMILPFLEETVETSNTHDGESCEEAMMNSDDACLYLSVHQMNSCDQEPDINSNSVESDEVDCFDPHLFIKNFPDLSDVVPSFWPRLLPKETWKRKAITLVLDLDGKEIGLPLLLSVQSYILKFIILLYLYYK